MPKRITPLTDTTVRKIKPAEKPKKLFNGGALFLLVTPTGGKLWRLKYRFGGIEKLLALGAYPQTSLADARQKRDPSADLRGSILPASGKHMATIIDPKEIAGLLRSIDDYRGSAEWSEFNLDAAELRTPAEKMKAGVLREIHPLAGHGRYVFPSPRTNSRPMRSNAILSALRPMG